MITQFCISLPPWLEARVAGLELFPSLEDRMAFVIELARQNVRNRTGGPFGAAIFNSAGKLVAAGVNLVETTNCSLLHAEMVAIAFAQKALGRYDLSDGDRHEYELAAASEPCAMCFGAVPWSGVRRLVCGARDEDVRSIGFEEGPKPAEWKGLLEQRGITVVRDVLRKEATEVLQEYRAAGGTIYNAGRAARKS